MKSETKKQSSRKSQSPGILESIKDTLKDMLVAEKPDLQDLFVKELQDLMWAEEHLAENLPMMAQKATTRELRDALLNHHEETLEHINRLKDVFATIGEEASSKQCDAMDGIVMEAKATISETPDKSLLRDVAIILCAQKAEHYEIASYGSLRVLAQALGHRDAADLLSITLDEEKNADLLLSEIAEGFVNREAMQEKK